MKNRRNNSNICANSSISVFLVNIFMKKHIQIFWLICFNVKQKTEDFRFDETSSSDFLSLRSDNKNINVISLVVILILVPFKQYCWYKLLYSIIPLTTLFRLSYKNQPVDFLYSSVDWVFHNENIDCYS